MTGVLSVMGIRGNNVAVGVWNRGRLKDSPSVGIGGGSRVGTKTFL